MIMMMMYCIVIRLQNDLRCVGWALTSTHSPYWIVAVVIGSSHFRSTAALYWRCPATKDDIWCAWLTWLAWKAMLPPASLEATSAPWNTLVLPVPFPLGPPAYHGCAVLCVHACDPPNRPPNLSYTWPAAKMLCPPPVRWVSVVRFRKTRLIDETWSSNTGDVNNLFCLSIYPSTIVRRTRLSTVGDRASPVAAARTTEARLPHRPGEFSAVVWRFIFSAVPFPIFCYACEVNLTLLVISLLTWYTHISQNEKWKPKHLKLRKVKYKDNIVLHTASQTSFKNNQCRYLQIFHKNELRFAHHYFWVIGPSVSVHNVVPVTTSKRTKMNENNVKKNNLAREEFRHYCCHQNETFW